MLVIMTVILKMVVIVICYEIYAIMKELNEYMLQNLKVFNLFGEKNNVLVKFC